LSRLLGCGLGLAYVALLYRVRNNDYYTLYKGPGGNRGGGRGNRRGISSSNSSGVEVVTLVVRSRSRVGDSFVRNAQADREPGVIRYGGAISRAAIQSAVI